MDYVGYVFEKRNSKTAKSVKTKNIFLSVRDKGRTQTEE